MRLEAVTRRQQGPGLHDITDAIGAGGGWIVNHQLYSNAMAMVAFVMPGDALAALADRLGQAGIPLVGQAGPWPTDPAERQVQLVVTFLHGGPDLARPVPAFG